jgi:hypothetical protein
VVQSSLTAVRVLVDNTLRLPWAPTLSNLNLMMSCSGSPKKMQDDYLLNLHICVTLTLMLARLTATVQLFLPRSGWPLHSVTLTVVSHSKTADSNPCESDLACDFLELVKPCPGQCCTVQ